MKLKKKKITWNKVTKRVRSNLQVGKLKVIDMSDKLKWRSRKKNKTKQNE